MRLPFDQSLAYLFETIAYGGVTHLVSDLNDQAADEPRISRNLQDRGGPCHRRQPQPQGLLLGSVQRDGRAHLHNYPLVPAIPDLAALPGQSWYQVEPAAPVQHAEESQDDAFDLISENLLQNSVFLGHRHLR